MEQRDSIDFDEIESDFEAFVQGIQASSVNSRPTLTQGIQASSVNSRPTTLEQVIERMEELEIITRETKRSNRKMMKKQKQSTVTITELNNRITSLTNLLKTSIRENAEFRKQLRTFSSEKTQWEEERLRLIDTITQFEIPEAERISHALKAVIDEASERKWGCGFFSSVPKGIQEIRNILYREKYNESWLDLESNNNGNIDRLIDLAVTIHDLVQGKVNSSCATRSEETNNFYIRSYKKLSSVLGRYETSEIEKIDFSKARKIQSNHTESSIHSFLNK